jgi:hypothetical protein
MVCTGDTALNVVYSDPRSHPYPQQPATLHPPVIICGPLALGVTDSGIARSLHLLDIHDATIRKVEEMGSDRVHAILDNAPSHPTPNVDKFVPHTQHVNLRIV